MQDIIVYVIIGMAVVYILNRYFRFGKRKKKGGSFCESCENCPLHKECRKNKNENFDMEKKTSFREKNTQH